jgi:gamma-glutamyltranspeptidase/glutathione hydrolase
MQKPLHSLAVVALLAACASTATPRSFSYKVPDQPEGLLRLYRKARLGDPKFAVAAANPLATDAGYQILKAGGSAVDAAIAVQMVLTLVEPQSSGIGGGAFLLHFNGKDVEAFDGRETAPSGHREALPQGRRQAHGVLSKAWWVAARWARRARCACWRWRTSSTASCPGHPVPARHCAGRRRLQGQPRLNTLLKPEVHLKKDPVAAAYFYEADGRPWPVGHVLKNPELAAVLADRRPGLQRRCWKATSPRPSWTRCKSIPPTRAS